MIKALRKRPLDGDFHNPTKTVYKDRQHMGQPVPVSYQGSLRPSAGSPVSRPAPEAAALGWARERAGARTVQRGRLPGRLLPPGGPGGRTRQRTTLRGSIAIQETRAGGGDLTGCETATLETGKHHREREEDPNKGRTANALVEKMK